MSRGRPHVHAHRGAPLKFAENTAPGFVYAVEAGADFIELDLGVARDGVLVVSHDPWLKPDGAWLKDVTSEEARARGCALLEDVLALAGHGEFRFNLEVKSFPERPELAPAPERFAEMVAGAVRARGLERRTLIQSFDFRVTRAMRRIAPELPCAALWQGEPRAALAIAAEAETGAVSIEWHLVDGSWFEDARAAGVETLVWTVNGERAWEEALAWGAGGVITDDAAGLIAYLRARGL
jgi:glycerophosphoryl diester phosphodiesterase